jgi:hypothetical protein
MSLNEAGWRKSSYSANGGGDCVEVAWVDTAAWRKSSRSANGGGACVEVAWGEQATAVRDSKNPAVAPLVFPATAWRRFASQADSDFGSGRTSSSSLSA